MNHVQVVERCLGRGLSKVTVNRSNFSSGTMIYIEMAGEPVGANDQDLDEEQVDEAAKSMHRATEQLRRLWAKMNKDREQGTEVRPPDVPFP